MQAAAQETTADIASLPGTRQKRIVTAEREQLIVAMQQDGVKTLDIAKALGLSISTVYQVSAQVKKNGNNPLLTPRRIKTATRVLDTFMAGKPIGRVVSEDLIDPETNEKKVIDPGVYPKCSTIKACADSVLDRAYPKAQETEGKGNISFTQVNISLAGPTAQPAIVDITPQSDTT